MCVCIHLSVCECVHTCVCVPVHTRAHTHKGKSLCRFVLYVGCVPQHSTCWEAGEPPGASPVMCLGPVPPSRDFLHQNPSLIYAPASSYSLSHLLKTWGTCRGAPISSSLRISKHCVVYLLNTPYVCTQSLLLSSGPHHPPWPRAAILGGASYLRVLQELPPSHPPRLPALELTPRCLSLACPTFLPHFCLARGSPAS